ncbi:hypothetical protein I3842_02G150900 [Carya illinoinensis]|uniref:Uncharacterized protein n=1 Tax=Carya illinoinensis TaxID=32201 RepID=A0A922K0G7_CARIL|nr:hypothetical protein I3842_02G150900 [Carya illinoinensis]
MHEFVPQRTAAYISPHDLHMPEMTVRETLTFSARCQGVGSRHEWLADLSRREKEAHIKPDPDIDVFMKAASIEGQKTNVVTDYIIKILVLEVCADTLVGDEILRRISGGQKKRVTTVYFLNLNMYVEIQYIKDPRARWKWIYQDNRNQHACMPVRKFQNNLTIEVTA